jgi:hypothetical protein
MYSVAIENSQLLGHITEKFTDCILSGTVPIYFGAPDIGDFYPKDSYIWLPIDSIEKSLSIIENLSKDDYLKRIPALLEAQRRYIEFYSLSAFIYSEKQAYTTTKQERKKLIPLWRIDGLLRNVINFFSVALKILPSSWANLARSLVRKKLEESSITQIYTIDNK